MNLLDHLPKTPPATEEERIADILAECSRQSVTMADQRAYVLATAQWETNHTFLPVREAYFLKNPLKYLNTLRYRPYWGRGLVQLTWKYNYERYEKILGLPLISNPDLALRWDVAVFVLVHGMKHGIFTGKSLHTYINSKYTDLYSARRIINGLDKATEIMNLAIKHRKTPGVQL